MAGIGNNGTFRIAIRVWFLHVSLSYTYKDTQTYIVTYIKCRPSSRSLTLSINEIFAHFSHFLIQCNRFLVCLCCEKATYGCRGAMVPVHASIGLATFMLAIACCISGLTEKAVFTLG